MRSIHWGVGIAAVVGAAFGCRSGGGAGDAVGTTRTTGGELDAAVIVAAPPGGVDTTEPRELESGELRSSMSGSSGPPNSATSGGTTTGSGTTRAAGSAGDAGSRYHP